MLGAQGLRGLVPVALHLARELLDDGEHGKANDCRAGRLPQLFDPDRLADHSRLFEALYVELESRAPLVFSVKPAQQLIGLSARRTSAAVSRG